MSVLDDKDYTQSFGSLGFFWLGNGQRTTPLIGRTARYQRDPIPFGNNAVIQKSGYDDAPLSHQAVIKTADWSAWLAAVNTSATLTIVGASASTAYLAEVSNPEQYPDDANALTVTLTFIF